MEEKFHSKKFSHSHRVSISFQCIRPEFRSVLLSFFLCGISLPYIYFYACQVLESHPIIFFLDQNKIENSLKILVNLINN